MTTLPLLALLGASALVTSFISGILGMAGGMILMGILLAVLPLAEAMTLHGVTQMASNGSRAWMLRRHVDWRVARGYALGALVALGAFAAARVVLDKATAFVVLGAMPFVAFLLPRELALDVGRRGHSFLCGVVCVALSLTAGVSGPILDTFFARTDMPRHAVVATKALTQAGSHLLKVAYFGALATAGGVPLAVVAGMVALTFVGTHLSRGVLERLTDASFRTWTRGTIAVVGAGYLAVGLRGMLR